MVLAAGLIWSFFIENPEWQKNIRFFFGMRHRGHINGIYGAFSASRKYFCTSITSDFSFGCCIIKIQKNYYCSKT